MAEAVGLPSESARAQQGPKNRVASAVVALAPWAVTAAVAAAWLSTQPKQLPPPPPKPDAPPPPPGLSEEVIADPAHFAATEPGRGRMAAWPHQIPWLGWKDVIWRSYREITHDRLTAVAGSVTFYSLLAIFPALGVFVSLYGLIADVRAVQELVFPGEVVRIVGDQMMRLATERSANLSAAFLVSLVISIWSANAGMKALFDGLNIAYDELEKRNYFYRTALTYAFTFAFLLFVCAVTAIMVALPIALKAAMLPQWLLDARWLLLFLVVTGAFSVAYRYGPCRRRAKWRWVTWGAAAAAFVWMAGSAGFSFYINNIAHLQVTYGSLGAVIGFMLWVWLSVMIILMGAELNAEIEHQTALDSTVGAQKPMGKRGAAMADTVGLPFIGVRKGVGLLWGIGRRMSGNLARQARRRPAPQARQESSTNYTKGTNGPAGSDG
jgi:membrane protein